MRDWDARRVAAAAGAALLSGPAPGGRPGAAPGPARVVIDSRQAGPGDLFVGLPGQHVDGGTFAGQALAGGAWGVLVTPQHAEGAERYERDEHAGAGAVLAHGDPLAALGRLAHAWRAALGARVVGITGSTGKTSTKDILAALLGDRLRTVATAENLNTEIGLPLTILGAPPGTEALVLEMAMRGPCQIAELTSIAAPDVGLIVNIGPVHLEQLGSIEAVAAAKAELIAGLVSGATAVIPADEPLLDAHRRADLHTVTFGTGGDVVLQTVRPDGEVVISSAGQTITVRPSFSQRHNIQNLLGAVAASVALGVTPDGELQVAFSAMRGQRVDLPGGAVLINDCYNANPMSMRAALDDLAATAGGRRVAVLGDMLELGDEELALHRQIGEHAAGRGVDVLVCVGPRAVAIGEAAMGKDTVGEIHTVDHPAAAAALLAGLLRDGDTVLVKGSRGVHLEGVAEALLAGVAPATETVGPAR
jgi:UDP-N-acetylmuramoyl-tripeptide--D-alanyl-D-alanine ligase